MHVFSPAIYAQYAANMAALLREHSHLAANFPNTVWAACTVNFGPGTYTIPHVDVNNLPWGWCSITSLGHFNPDLGGHLILWNLGLVIRFPPGSTILIPSAILRHSNTAIQPGETRYSFVQFTAGGLFRWVYNGFKSDADWHEAASPAQKAQRKADDVERRVNGFKSFQKWKDLHKLVVEARAEREAAKKAARAAKAAAN